ncbi:hypothetical protein K461DRAFT_112855 [Myriangium duriaei CBS 260.36]|uniref:Uncharacterized protein n=1 Tax=Myriangium duriaei CBS 260.36 TaxID=1168546 RepID=A0A9P4MJK0_9PEZI|nr:hypothetical protein K461DRAFT_112855 [Myriangium duriaei CBS 260.36]
MTACGALAGFSLTQGPCFSLGDLQSVCLSWSHPCYNRLRAGPCAFFMALRAKKQGFADECTGTRLRLALLEWSDHSQAPRNAGRCALTPETSWSHGSLLNPVRQSTVPITLSATHVHVSTPPEGIIADPRPAVSAVCAEVSQGPVMCAMQ